MMMIVRIREIQLNYKYENYIQSWNESMLFCLPQGEYQGVMMLMRKWYMSRVKLSPPTNVASTLMTLIHRMYVLEKTLQNF